MNYIYEFPWGKGKRWLQQGPLAAIAGNWQLSGITTFGAGTPVVITGPNDLHLPGVGGYANRLKSAVIPADQRNIDRWFDTTAFAPAPAYTLPNGSRTEPNLRNPGINTTDLGLSRTQRIGERFNIQFRAEFFSAFNTPQFAEPNGSITNVNFGKITLRRRQSQHPTGSANDILKSADCLRGNGFAAAGARAGHPAAIRPGRVLTRPNFI